MGEETKDYAQIGELLDRVMDSFNNIWLNWFELGLILMPLSFSCNIKVDDLEMYTVHKF